MKKVRLVLVLAVVVLFFSGIGQATVTPVFHWAMGENDPGATAGSAATNPAYAAVGGINLGKVNNPSSFAYSSDVPANTTSDSTLSVNFAAKAVADIYVTINGGLSAPVDNWVFEGWFKPVDLTGAKNLAFFGDLYSNVLGTYGYGFYQINEKLYASFSGIGHIPIATAVAGEWVHLAIVRDSATFATDSQGVRFYVNGQKVANPGMGAAPYQAYGMMSMGGNYPSLAELNNGLADDVRFSTFTAGAFKVSDLLVVPEPATLSIIGLGGLLLVRRKKA